MEELFFFSSSFASSIFWSCPSHCQYEVVFCSPHPHHTLPSCFHWRQTLLSLIFSEKLMGHILSPSGNLFQMWPVLIGWFWATLFCASSLCLRQSINLGLPGPSVLLQPPFAAHYVRSIVFARCVLQSSICQPCRYDWLD